MDTSISMCIFFLQQKKNSYAPKMHILREVLQEQFKCTKVGKNIIFSNDQTFLSKCLIVLYLYHVQYFIFFITVRQALV